MNDTPSNSSHDQASELRKLELELDYKKYRVRLGLWGTIIAGALVTIVTALLNWQIQNHELELEKEHSTRNLELQRLQTTRELDLARENSETEYLGRFVQEALNKDLPHRIRFAHYFATLTRSEEVRKLWAKYHAELLAQLGPTRDDLIAGIQELETATDLGRIAALEIEIARLRKELTGSSRAQTLPSSVLRDRVRVAIRAIPRTLDPRQVTTIDELALVDLLYSRLVMLDRGTFLPDLAEAWEVSADGATFRFTLRPGLRYTDGSIIDANSVAENLNRERTIEALGINDVLLLDSHTIELTSSKLPHELLLKLATSAHGLIANVNNVMASSGKYYISDLTQGTRLILVRNERYHGLSAKYGEIAFLAIANPEAAFRAFQSGEIDFLDIANLE
jgi:hypothetical protein